MAVSLPGTGVFSNNTRALQKLIAASDTFQAMCGVSTEVAALAHVHSPEASDREGEEDQRPRAIVIASAPQRSKKGPGSWSNHGCSLLSIEFVAPDAFKHSPQDAFAWVLQQLDNILLEMEATSDSRSGGYLNMTGWRTVEGPAQAIKDNENQDDFWGVTLEVDWY